MMQGRGARRTTTHLLVAVAVTVFVLQLTGNAQHTENTQGDIVMEHHYHRNAALQPQQDKTTTCINTCTADDMKDTNGSTSGSHVSSVAALSRSINVQLDHGQYEGVDDEEDEDVGFFSLLLRRLMTGIFHFISQPQEKERKTRYVVSTTAIIPELTKHSSKFQELSQLIRNDSRLATTRPDIIETMYTLSAENMEATANALNGVVANIQQQQESYGNDTNAIDITTLSCTMMPFLSALQDTTIPNIELMIDILYNETSHNDTLKLAYSRHVSKSKSKVVLPDIDNNDAKEQCITTIESLETQSSLLLPSSSLRLFSRNEVISSNEIVDILPYIYDIIISIIFFPISIVISLLNIILIPFALIILIILSLLPGDIPVTSDDDGGWVWLAVVFVILLVAGSPILTILIVLENIASVFADLIDPFIPNPPPSPAPSSDFVQLPPISVPGQQPFNPRDPSYHNKLASSVSNVLISPIDLIIDMVVQQKVAATYWNQKDEDAVDCQLNQLICNSNALMDVLPV